MTDDDHAVPALPAGGELAMRHAAHIALAKNPRIPAFYAEIDIVQVARRVPVVMHRVHAIA